MCGFRHARWWARWDNGWWLSCSRNSPLRMASSESRMVVYSPLAISPFAPLNQHLAFFGDGVFDLFHRIAEQHFVMGTARRNHRKAVLRRIDDAIEDHRFSHLDHFPDLGIEIG